MERPPAILCLDLGTQTGWAMTCKPILSGTLDLSGRRYEGGGMRYLRFRGWLDEMQRLGTISAVYFEEVRNHRGVDAAHVHGGLLAILTAWCEQNKVPYQGIPVGTIKKHATGRGNANKDAMIAAAKARGHDPWCHNEADAVCLLYCVMETEPAVCSLAQAREAAE